MKYSEEFIRAIPKTDLHLHLDGSLRLPTLIELAKKGKIELPSYTEEGLKETVFKESYNNLGEYLHGFMYTCEILRDLENLERCSYELAVDNQNEGVRYIEVRFAPQLQMNNKDLTMETILEAVHKGLDRAKQEFNNRPEIKSGEQPPFNYSIIACAMRMFGPKHFSPYYTNLYSAHQYSDSIDVIKMGALELAKAVVRIRNEKGIPVTGFDLAGQEDGYPAEDFVAAYQYIHKNFMHKTVHAGEAYGAESIFQAITDLYADRLGHGFYLFDKEKITNPDIKDKDDYIERLSSIIAEKRITIEVCLTSNLQTNPNLKDIKDHSFKDMLQHKISTTICTDNRLVSNTTVTKEIMMAVNNFDITPKTLKNLLAYGLKRSFYPGSYTEKRAYTVQNVDYFTKLAKKYNVVIE